MLQLKKQKLFHKPSVKSLLMCHWLELGHMDVPGPRKDWIRKCLVFPLFTLEVAKEKRLQTIAGLADEQYLPKMDPDQPQYALRSTVRMLRHVDVLPY